MYLKESFVRFCVTLLLNLFVLILLNYILAYYMFDRFIFLLC